MGIKDMNRILIKGAKIINEGEIQEKDLLIEGEVIIKIDNDITDGQAKIIDAGGKFLLPGLIDDQVHFREPGLIYKAEIYTESKAAVAGGITSFMEMPNTVPNVLTQELLEHKYTIANRKSLVNYSFFMGASNDNLEEVLKTDAKNVCGVKVFMGSSTGNMLVDNATVLNSIFAEVPLLIATHCEDEQTIRDNTAKFREEYGENLPAKFHPMIRTSEACYKSSSLAVDLAKKHDARLHVLHISTVKETELFRNDIPLSEKKITAEACIHHLWFCDEDYDEKEMFIKWNPAVKTKEDRDAVFKAVLDDRIDVIATDHAPHTLEEKSQSYFNAPSGGPLVQHSLVAMLEFFHQGKISLERIVEKMCHNPAILFQVENRGFIREGYFADLVLVDLNSSWTVSKDNVLAKCGWSPFEGTTFASSVVSTFVSGHQVYNNGSFDESKRGHRLTFNRN